MKRKAVNQLLVAAVDAFLEDDSLNSIRLERSESGGAKIQSANLLAGNPPKLITYVGFKGGNGKTIYDLDPQWKEKLNADAAKQEPER